MWELPQTLTLQINSHQNKTFSYDKLGRVKKETRVILATTEGNPLPTETAGPHFQG